MLWIIGAGIVLYQVSESCEDSALAGGSKRYPWCTDVLDHINLTFARVVALLAGVVVLAHGGALHWILEPSTQLDDPASEQDEGAPLAPCEV